VQASADRTALHSFPTRRSSDLRPLVGAGGRDRAGSGVVTVTAAAAPRRARLLPRATGFFSYAGFLPAIVLLGLFFLVPLGIIVRSEEHTSELQSRGHLVCRLLL